MIINLSESITAGFDDNSLRDACVVFKKLRNDESDETLLALLVVISFWALEKKKPGFIDRLNGEIKTINSKRHKSSEEAA